MFWVKEQEERETKKKTAETTKRNKKIQNPKRQTLACVSMFEVAYTCLIGTYK